MVITYSKGKDQPGKVANPARGQLAEQGKLILPCPRLRLRIWPRETGSAVSSGVSLLISILRLNLVLTYGIPPEFCGGVHLLSVHIEPSYVFKEKSECTSRPSEHPPVRGKKCQNV